MKTFLLSLTSLLLFFCATAQTADDIVNKHIDGIGGKDKLSQITSYLTEKTTEVMGNEFKTTTTVVNGKGYRNAADFNGQQLVQVVTDKGGWNINPFTGSAPATALTPEEYKSTEDAVYLPDPLFNYAQHGAKVELVGQEKVGNINAFKLSYTNKDSAVSTFYIDPSTWYIIQEVSTGIIQGQQTSITISYSDYKKTDFGVFVPYTVGIDMGQYNLKNTTTKVEFNKSVDPTIFDMPK